MNKVPLLLSLTGLAVSLLLLGGCESNATKAIILRNSQSSINLEGVRVDLSNAERALREAETNLNDSKAAREAAQRAFDTASVSHNELTSRRDALNKAKAILGANPAIASIDTELSNLNTRISSSAKNVADKLVALNGATKAEQAAASVATAAALSYRRLVIENQLALADDKYHRIGDPYLSFKYAGNPVFIKPNRCSQFN